MTVEYPQFMPARSLRTGHVVDLAEDPVANGPCSAEQLTGVSCDGREYGKAVTWQYEYGIVYELEQETPGCIRVDFDNGDSIGFPLDHELLVVGKDWNA